MTKKGENIYKRKDGRWEGRYQKARNEQGQLIYGYVYGYKYKEVKLKLEQLKAQYAFPMQEHFLFKGTVEDWMTYWLNHLIVKQIKPSTYASYQLKIKQHITPFLGHKRLLQVSEKEVRQFLIYLTEKGLSTTTVHTVFTILKAALAKAVSERVLQENPCTGILPPKMRKQEITVLTRDQQRCLERVALQEITGSPVIIALYTGMRIGEISGLKWSDIDLENRTIHVLRTMQRIMTPDGPTKTKLIMGPPKSKSSVRKIPIAKNLVHYLTEKKKQATSSFVIDTKNGVAEPRLINFRFKQLLIQAKLAHIHFHVLRHTFATRCIEQGIDVATVSKLLGHQSTKMTLDTYAGSLWETREKAMAVIDTQLDVLL